MSTPAKRSREENECELEEARSDRKKPRTLPFRTSPTSKHGNLFSQARGIPRPPVLTPAESEDGSDPESPKYNQTFLPHLTACSNMPIDDAASDLEMVDSEPLSSPPRTPSLSKFPTSTSSAQDVTPLFARSINQAQQLPISTTRIPTPIYGHFNISPQEGFMGTPTRNCSSEMSTPESHIYSESHHDLFLHRRRLPTPIDENADMESPTTVTGSMLRNLDMGATSASQVYAPQADAMAGSRLRILDMDGTAAISTDQDPFSEGDTNMIMPDSPLRPANNHLDSDFRNKRRGALVEGSALKGVIGKGGTNPGGKIGFSMGFRADCEKCRDHVPGHYAHFLKYD